MLVSRCFSLAPCCILLFDQSGEDADIRCACPSADKRADCVTRGSVIATVLVTLCCFMQQSELSARVYACKCAFEGMHASRADHHAINSLSQGVLSFTAFADLLAAACEASALVMTSCQTTWYEKLETGVDRPQS